MTEQTQSCIKTRCTVDKAHVLRWLLSMFPEVAEDATFDGVQDNYSGALIFTVEHTKQEPKPVGPILLGDPNGHIKDAEDPVLEEELAEQLRDLAEEDEGEQL